MAPQLEDVESGYDTFEQLFVTDASFREAHYNSELLEPADDLTSPAYDMPGDSSPAVHAMDDDAAVDAPREGPGLGFAPPEHPLARGAA